MYDPDFWTPLLHQVGNSKLFKIIGGKNPERPVKYWEILYSLGRTISSKLTWTWEIKVETIKWYASISFYKAEPSRIFF